MSYLSTLRKEARRSYMRHGHTRDSRGFSSAKVKGRPQHLEVCTAASDSGVSCGSQHMRDKIDRLMKDSEFQHVEVSEISTKLERTNSNLEGKAALISLGSAGGKSCDFHLLTSMSNLPEEARTSICQTHILQKFERGFI
ncbi:hypothetical protein MKZ38_001818 [Zalerion maritima]|uniref:Uncharacterized protein n=1 Tax=Zalerion maritima TaxID=339359 RepID=A0AAD5RPW4_9PEZI|nr:hypothetical protein MKZ38_001818 [Zalerion maritima]